MIDEFYHIAELHGISRDEADALLNAKRAPYRNEDEAIARAFIHLTHRSTDETITRETAEATLNAWSVAARDWTEADFASHAVGMNANSLEWMFMIHAIVTLMRSA